MAKEVKRYSTHPNTGVKRIIVHPTELAIRFWKPKPGTVSCQDLAVVVTHNCATVRFKSDFYKGELEFRLVMQ